MASFPFVRFYSVLSPRQRGNKRCYDSFYKMMMMMRSILLYLPKVGKVGRVGKVR